MFIYSIQNAKNNYDMHEEKKNVEIIFPKINIVEQYVPSTNRQRIAKIYWSNTVSYYEDNLTIFFNTIMLFLLSIYIWILYQNLGGQLHFFL